jgi:hypothetical protein
MAQQKVKMSIVQMINVLPKTMPKNIYACKGIYPSCICIEYLDFEKVDHRRIYKNCFITSLSDRPRPTKLHKVFD